MRAFFKGVIILAASTASGVQSADEPCAQDFAPDTGKDLSTVQVERLLLELASDGTYCADIPIVLKGQPMLVPVLAEFREGLGAATEAMEEAGEADLADRVALHALEHGLIDRVGDSIHANAQRIDEPLLRTLLTTYLDSSPTYCKVIIRSVMASSRAELARDVVSKRAVQGKPTCGLESDSDVWAK